MLFVFDPTVLASRTVMTVPAGSVTSLEPNRLADLLEGALESGPQLFHERCQVVRCP